jgi:hypothetical protein
MMRSFNMAITRYFAPKGPDGTHLTMDKNVRGAFVRYLDHKEKIRHLRARVLELETMLYGDAGCPAPYGRDLANDITDGALS